MTIEEFDKIFASQGQRCAICGAKEPGGKRRWNVDHCHSTHKVRGILCFNCNAALGALKDNPLTLCAAIFYLNLKGVNMTVLNFDAFQYDPTQGGSICFPLGDYRLEITKVEPQQVKDNPGAGYLAIHLTCVDGDLKGMTQIDRLNIYNPSEVAKRIALQQLAAYAFAIGRPQLATSEQMLGGKLICTIGPQTDNPKYSEVKQIKCPDGSLPINPNKGGNQPAPQQGAPAQPGWGAPAAQAPPADPGAATWGAGTQPPAGAAAPPWGGQPAPPAAGAPPWASGFAAPAASATPPWVK
jgi:hypothetical protein